MLHTAWSPDIEPRPRPALRERVLRSGTEPLADVDLLSLLLGTGTERESATAIAARLLDTTGGIAGLARQGAHALAARPGIGHAKAARIVAALELGRRANVHLLDETRDAFPSLDHVVRWARPRLAHLEHEEVWLLALDGRNGLRVAQKIAQGGLHATALTPSDVLRPALRSGASTIILLHNHPSGDPRPSADDIQMTRALDRACQVVGVPLVDHVVVARDGAVSLRDVGAIGG